MRIQCVGGILVAIAKVTLKVAMRHTHDMARAVSFPPLSLDCFSLLATRVSLETFIEVERYGLDKRPPLDPRGGAPHAGD